MKKGILVCLFSILSLALTGLQGLWAAPVFDYDVTHISQNPKYFKYSLYEVFDQAGYWSSGSGIPIQVAGTENQKRWPQTGEPITFTAHVRNKGTSSAPPFHYRWSINGAVVGEGYYPSATPPGQDAKVVMVFPWPAIDPKDHSKDTITFRVLTPDELPQNNQLTDYLAALSLSIWVDTGQYNAFNALENQIGTYSFEDWVQWQVRTLNERFGQAIYEGIAPRGILERVRIEKIVVADKVRPLMNQDPDAKVIDGRWQFEGSSQQDYDHYAQTHAKKIDWGLLHEIAHQLGVIDLYRIGLSPIDNFVRDDEGNPVNIGKTPFRHAGIMGGGSTVPHNDGTYFSSHDAGALNANLGYRRGYYGEYLYDVPKQNFIKILDNQGRPVAGAKVTVYQKATPQGRHLAQPLLKGERIAKLQDASLFHPGMQVNIANSVHNEGNNGDFITTIISIDLTKNPHEITLADGARFDYALSGLVMRRLECLPGKAKFTGFTDANGLYALPNDPPYQTRTTATGHTLGPNPFGTINVVGTNSILFFKVEARGQTEYFDLDITDFNLAYWSGSKDSHTFTRNTQIPPVGAPEPPKEIRLQREGEKVILTWSPSPSAVRYNVYRGSYPHYAYSRIAPSIPAEAGKFVDTVDFGHNVRYAVTAVNGNGLESRFSRIAIKPLMVIPNKVAITLDGERFITDLHPHEGWVVKQDREDQFQNFFIRHFGRANAAAIDPRGRLVVASSGPFRILIYDPVSGQLINQFGTDGTQIGRIRDPMGVAVDEEGYIYVSDSGNHRVQVFGPDYQVVASMGGMGSREGEFQNPSGIAVDPQGRVYIADTGNKRIQIFRFDRSVKALIRERTLTHDFSEPRDVALDAAGNIYVADTKNNRIVKFDREGRFLEIFRELADGLPKTLSGPQGVAVDKITNQIVVADTGNRRIVSFQQAAPPPVTISAKAAPGGSIRPAGNVAVPVGSDQAFAITPATGYRILDVKVNGVSKGPVNTYTFIKVRGNHTIEAAFLADPVPLVITATAGEGGTIAPKGAVTVPSGSMQTFAITPNTGYRIADVKVNGVSQGAISSYTFKNVTASHTIHATFAPAGGSGTQVVFAVNCGGAQYTDTSGVVYKADMNFSGGQTYKTTAPITGTSDGVLYQSERYGNFSYNIPVQNGSYNVTLKFAEIYAWQKGQRVFRVRIEGREVITNLDLFDKAGGKNVAYDLSFPVTVNDGVLTIEFITVLNSAKVNAILITSGQPVVSYTITASAGAGGTISPSGAVTVAQGSNQIFTISPNAGYRVADVRVNGVSQGAISSYTFQNVTANHSIGATFQQEGGGSQVVFAVNCGGAQYTSPSGVLYKADTNFSGGQTYKTTAPITGTSDGVLYQSERWGRFSYSIPVPNGTYMVTLKFAELYCSTVGCRVFSTKIEGREVITNLDVIARAGGKNRAYDVVIPVTVSDGILNIEFYNTKGDAKVNAILVTGGTSIGP